jgi:hypothetical protein
MIRREKKSIDAVTPGRCRNGRHGISDGRLARIGKVRQLVDSISRTCEFELRSAGPDGASHELGRLPCLRDRAAHTAAGVACRPRHAPVELSPVVTCEAAEVSS